MPVKRNNTQIRWQILTQPMASEVREDEDLLVPVAEESAEISWRAFPECREGAHWQRQQAARLTVTATHYCTVHTAHWPSPQSKHCQQSHLKQLSSSGLASVNARNWRFMWMDNVWSTIHTQCIFRSHWIVPYHIRNTWYALLLSSRANPTLKLPARTSRILQHTLVTHPTPQLFCSKLSFKLVNFSQLRNKTRLGVFFRTQCIRKGITCTR